MLVSVVVLLVSFVVILAGAELFTNGIEWLGRKLRLGEGAVGSVLAAVGTALPETLIPIIAIGFGGAGERTDEIGVGAILGAPFMLSTLALAVTAVAVLGRARRRPVIGDRLTVDADVVGADVGTFFIAYLIAIASALVPSDLEILRWVAAASLLVVYALYVRAHLGGDPGPHLDLAPLRLGRFDRVVTAAGEPRLRIVVIQVAIALLAIIAGAVAFVRSVEELSTTLGVAPIILALIIAPIATELPEKFNSILWIRQGKDTLAIGNITGAMVFQACLPVSVAILFAPHSWTLSAETLPTFASAVIALVSSAVIFWPMWRHRPLTGRRLLVGGGFYAAYLVYLALFAGTLGHS
jgi:cation:H+ antiporter